MKRTAILTIALLLSTLLIEAQTAVGSWRSHLAYHNATQCVVLKDKVYVVSDGSLYSYCPEDESVESYDKTNILNDQGIRYIAADEQSNTLVIIYENGNIDFILPNGDAVNITDFTNATTFDPQVNNLRIVDGKAYLATNFGLTVLNIKQREFENTYVLGKATHCCVELNGVIYAATQEGLYCGNTQNNLLDITNWEPLSNDVYTQLAVFDERLMALKPNESVYTIALTDGTPTLFRKGSFLFISCIDSKFVAGNKANIYIYTTPESCIELTFDGTVKSFTTDGETYWTCNGPQGLNGYRLDEKNKCVVQTASGIAPNSPIRNYCQYLSFVDDNRLLVAGGCLNYLGTTFYEGTLMMYEDGTWHTFEEEGIAKRTAGHYKNMTSIVQDPKDPNHHYASSYGQGIYEFRDMKFIRQYTDKEKPGLSEVVASPLESAVPTSYEYTRISRLQYDEQGNLWITNSHGVFPLKFIKPNGEFINLYYPELEGQETMGEVLFDHNGWIWAVSLQGPATLFCIDMNGTPENTSDDRVKVFDEKFIDQDGGSVIIYYINDIAEDSNGDIWVMTDKGPYVLYNTEDVFEANYHFTKIKVPRNDGTNYADYLLDGAYTTCIEIDAADRKWIGTLNNGLYLITGDGLETVHHFTADNSPLPSDGIESLALRHASGELFIGTDKGLVSYATDATRAEDTYDEEKVYAYPNPVTPDYNGLITVVGLKANTQVKVVNTAGRLVAEGTSLGGSFTWNGRTPQGQRVATGVYYVLGCDEEGREGIVTKVLFVK